MRLVAGAGRRPRAHRGRGQRVHGWLGRGRAGRVPGHGADRLRTEPGFSAGNNAGIDRALELAADWVLILNNDTVVAPDALRRLLAAAEAHPRAGILSPVIFFMEPDEIVWFGGARFDPARGRSGRMEHHRSRLPASSSVRTIDRATGAAMLVSRAAIEAAGAFDPDYFFLYEDVDLSLRVRDTGFDVVFVPSARVWHRVSATQGEPLTPTISYYGVRNNLMTCQRHAPLRGPAAWRRELACVATHVAGVRRARRSRTACLLALTAGWRDFHRRRFGPREGN